MKSLFLKSVLLFVLFPAYGFSCIQSDYDLVESFGSVGEDSGDEIIVTENYIYILGTFSNSVDFDSGVGVDIHVSNGGTDSYITKKDKSGNYIWTKTYGSYFDDDILSVEKDSLDNLYIIGALEGLVDYDNGSATFTSSNSSGYGTDLYIIKIDSNGTFLWGKTIAHTSGYNLVTSHSLTVYNGNIYIVGKYNGSFDFDPSASSFIMTYNGSTSSDYKGFILKLDENGNFIWVKENADSMDNIEVDNNGDLVILGTYRGTVDFDFGAGFYNLTNYKALFLLKITVNGDFIWVVDYKYVTYIINKSISVDSNNDIIILGEHHNKITFDTDTLISNGILDVFIAKFNTNGTKIWAKSFGGSDQDYGNSLVIDDNDQIYLSGAYNNIVDFNPGTQIANNTSLGGLDAYFLSLNSNGGFLWVKTFGGTGDDYFQDIKIDTSNVYLTGYFENTINFNNSNIISNGDKDVMFIKYNPALTTTNDAVTACNTYTWIDGNTYTTNNNTATDTLTNAAGCDSIITLDLTIINPSSSTDIQTACNTYTWIDGNTYTTNNNTATDTLTNAVGCDSIVTLNLTIENATTSTDTQSAPSPFTWIDGNTYTTNNNTATDTLTNANGCDSIITLNLTIIDTLIQGTITTSLAAPLQNSKVYLIQYFASSDSVFATDSTTTDATGFYQFTNTLQNAYVKAVPDVVNYPNEIPTYNVNSPVFQNADAVYLSYPFGNTDFSTIAGVNPGGNGFIGGIVGNGAGKQTAVGEPIPNLSLILINSSNEVVEQTTTDAGGLFSFADLEETTFSLWVDQAGILNNLAPSISLATETVQDDLEFKLHKTFLENITTVSIEELKNSDFEVYPNPTNGQLMIKNSQTAFKVELLNILGASVYSKNTNNNELMIDLTKNELSKGTYIIKLTTEKNTYFSKIVYR